MRISSIAEFGLLVRDVRQSLGLSQAQLAEQITGVSRQWVNNLESGKAKPDLDVVLRVLRAIGLDLEITRPGTSASTPANEIDEVLRRVRRLR